MDFLYLELLRQKKALAALLLGRRDETAEEPEPQRSEDGAGMQELPSVYGGPAARSRMFSADAAASEAFSADKRASGEQDGNVGELRRKAGQFFDHAASIRRFLHSSVMDAEAFETFAAKAKPVSLAASSGASETSGQRPVPGPLSAGDVPSGRRLSGTGGFPEQSPRPGGSFAEPAGSAVTVLRGGSPETASGTEMARAMSLAFQRDARRYDGGFRMN